MRILIGILMFFIFLLNFNYSFSQLNNDSLRKKYEHSDLYKETVKIMDSTSHVEGSTVLPDSILIPPIHYVDGIMVLDDSIRDFKTISVDLDILNDVPESYKLYISPLSFNINGMPFYCGLQTHSGGRKYPNGKDENVDLGRGAIFSRWYERSIDAINTNGYYASSSGEGDFISVRKSYRWTKGKFRIILFKDGYLQGKKVTGKELKNNLMFSYGDYEQTWVGMKVINLKTKKETIIGELAFPGGTLNADYYFSFFIENYGNGYYFSNKIRNIVRMENNSSYKKTKADKKDNGIGLSDITELPNVNIEMSNFSVDDKPRILKLYQTIYNPNLNPLQSKIKMKIPILADVKFDEKTNIIKISCGYHIQ